MTLCVAVLAFFQLACSDIQRPDPAPFFADSTPPAIQEFRWSNGRSPKSFDPARAAAAPETDIVRAIYEGLTETDPHTLQALPAVADKWASSDEFRTWTFHIRKDARWSNGELVTAADFVESWKRLVSLGDKAAHADLCKNIVGFAAAATPDRRPAQPNEGSFSPADAAGRLSRATLPKVLPPTPATAGPNESGRSLIDKNAKPDVKATPVPLGVVAVDDSTLRVSLVAPDKDFPKLVANPIFRPVYDKGAEFEADPLNAAVISNGAFVVQSAGKDSVVLARSKSYWNSAAVSLDVVRFTPKENAEAALDAYRRGEVDAVTNAEFEPLVLKLLSPYDDFRQTLHSALNFYEFNLSRPPFNDRRVREALTLAIDRERLAGGELESSVLAAGSFLPLGERGESVAFDLERARALLTAAGFPEGEGFPKIKVLVNRNDTQQRVAKVVTGMWKQNLNVDAEISVKEMSELGAAWATGEYDIMRRGVVLPTSDAVVSMAAIFGPSGSLDTHEVRQSVTPHMTPSPAVPLMAPPDDLSSDETPIVVEPGEMMRPVNDPATDFTAIPLYFPMSYALVKPYVNGFDTNALDAPLLRDTSIDSGWTPPSGR